MADWRDRLDGLSRGHRIKALLSFELANDRAVGEPVEVATATLRAVARAEGLDSGGLWIEAAAFDIAARGADRSALGGRQAERADGPAPPSATTVGHLPSGDDEHVTRRSSE